MGYITLDKNTVAVQPFLDAFKICTWIDVLFSIDRILSIHNNNHPNPLRHWQGKTHLEKTRVLQWIERLHVEQNIHLSINDVMILTTFDVYAYVCDVAIATVGPMLAEFTIIA